MTHGADPEPVIPKLRWWQILLAVLICVVYAASTRFYELDSPLLRLLGGNRRVDPVTLHMRGEFVENNLGLAR